MVRAREVDHRDVGRGCAIAVNGHHVASLLLTFFYPYMTDLLRFGHVYLGRPSLDRIRWGKHTRCAWEDSQRDEIISEIKGNAKAETTLDPSSRTLFRVGIHNPDLAERAVKDCFGKDSKPNYQFVMERSSEADEVDL